MVALNESNNGWARSGNPAFEWAVLHKFLGALGNQVGSKANFMNHVEAQFTQDASEFFFPDICKFGGKRWSHRSGNHTAACQKGFSQIKGINGYLGSLAAYLNTISATDAPLMQHHGLSVFNTDGFGGAFPHTGETGSAPFTNTGAFSSV